MIRAARSIGAVRTRRIGREGLRRLPDVVRLLSRSRVECRLSHQSMGGNGLIVSFGEVMPMRRGRLQRQSRRAFWASAAPEVSTSELAGWCWARQTLIEKTRALTLATGNR